MIDKIKGKKISHYKILKKIGEGGMGIVYKAEDTKLHRTVALKFLPVEKLGGKQERDRFMREAQASAALNHTNIATVYEIDEHEGQSFIAMEYVEGKNLKEMIESSPLKLKKAMDIASQTAQGLQAAHDKGVVHRDIKSSNIMVTEKNQVKIMDFGLAKLAGSSMLTQKGTTLGTAAYMSPEQTRGEDVDYRTDIWSFGVVLYEMVTGSLPFKGDYEQALIYSIVNETPEPLTALRSRVPMELERIADKCMAKDPDARYQHVNEIPVDLKAIDITSSGSSIIQPVPSKVAPVTKQTSKPKSCFSWIARILLFVFIIYCAWQLWKFSSPEPIRRVIINAEIELNFSSNSIGMISPDGKNVVYEGTQNGATMLFLRTMDKFGTIPIQGTEGAHSPFFSYDGKWIGFQSSAGLKKVSVFGGVPIALAQLDAFFGASWAPNDTIYFAGMISSAESNSPLLKISANGGEIKNVAQPTDSSAFIRYCFPDVLPGGKALLFTRLQMDCRNPDEGIIEVLDLKTGKSHIILEGGVCARYSSTGHIIAAWSGGLFAVPFNLNKLEVTGPTVPVLDGIFLNKGFIPNYSFSNDGTLIYLSGENGFQKKQLVLLNHNGESQHVFNQLEDFRHLNYSPNAAKLIVSIDRENKNQLWLVEPDKQTLFQFTFDGYNDYPIWTPDGKNITFYSDRNGKKNIYQKALKSHAPAKQLTTGDNKQFPTSWTPDGKTLAFCEDHPDSSSDIWVLKFDKDTTAQPFIATKHKEHQAMFSPDGKWIAYTSNKSGKDEIYVRPFPDTGKDIKISEIGGTDPIWHPTNNKLYFLQRNKLLQVRYLTAPVFKAEKPVELFKMDHTFHNYTISSNGDLFVFVVNEQIQPTKNFNVVLNWFEELKQQVPSGKRFFGLKLW
jgi:serine/threonine protein kinase/WD40 repeat protein